MKLYEIFEEHYYGLNGNINDKIEIWLKAMHIKNYDISKDGVVSVNGNVDITNRGLHQLPVDFGKVTGDFICASNRLTTLRGIPTFVGGNLDCSDNQLDDLEGYPTEVMKNFDCSKNKFKSEPLYRTIKVHGDFTWK